MSRPSTRTLSESDSKALLAGHGVPFPPEILAGTVADATAAARQVGLPVALKLCGENIAHKTERGLVRLGLASTEAVADAAADLLAAARPEDEATGVLVAPMVTGLRELIAGASRDPQFGPTILLGLGGVLAEAIGDVAVRLAPIDRVAALDMLDSLGAARLLGPFRGEPAVDRDALADVLVALSDAVVADSRILSIDLNPLMVADGRPVAVDALVELDESAQPATVPDPAGAPSTHDAEHFRALFEPRGVLVAGASTHPGKFGFVSLHNILAAGYEGRVVATNRDGAEVLGVRCHTTIEDLPDGEIDLVFVCTPAAANPDLLRAAAAKGIRAAFVTSAGYGEAGEEGRRAEEELVALCESLDMLLIGPNGQGVVSTPAHLCAQIVAPYPPAGSIGVASQSGNFVSSFLNWSCATGVGISRAVSAGNAAATSVSDLLEHFARDPATKVGLAYLEGIQDGRSVADALERVAAEMPVVVLKGGATDGGARAAASHTGSLATDDRTFDGLCRQFGVNRAATVEEAFEAAATFATQPLPRGNRVVVMTTAGGWGVVTADAITRHPELELLELPDDLRAAIDDKLPPRWSRNNPVDLAGGETRDTIPEVLALIAQHPEVDAVIHLGLGIQSNQARMMREGAFHGLDGDPYGLDRIVAYHERQDARFAQAAVDVSTATGKPVLSATELAVAFPDNAGPATVRANGRLCYPSADRAVTALGHLVARSRSTREREVRAS
jgi:acetyltransferase